MKQFRKYGQTGMDKFYEAEELLALVDEDAGSRLALILFKDGLIGGAEFLYILKLSEISFEERGF